MKRVVLYILFLLINLNLNAQVVYPIRSYTILQPPLPYNLNGFVSEPGKINLNIIVDDVDLDQYAVKFRLHIEGNGIKLTTRPDFFQQPYYLEGAGTHTLTGFDLEDLLNPDNLIFEGYSRNQYKQTGRLPEGVYRIWVDLYDYYRNVKVSMSSPGIAMIFLAKAPRLSFPLNQTEIDSDLMQNIRFLWFSILPADPLADVRYRFKLFEIRPDGRDPYEITRVMQPIYQEETNQSSFVYDAGMPPLISGMSYAWKVEAYDLENRVLFQNDGHSDVLSFRYGKSCEIPELSINEVKSKAVSLSWITDVAATEYTLAYKRTKDEIWQEEKTDLVNYTLTDLDDNAGYQIKIKAGCGDSETEFGRVQELKTTREVNYACGNKSDKFDLSNTEPLPSLGRFDEFKAADFLVEVEEVSGGNGHFTGKGYALIPYLGFLKFRVEFESIFVNSDSRMTSGEIKFVYDEATGMIAGETPYGEDEDDGVDVKDELDEISNKVIESDTDISSVTVSGDNVVITHTDGTSETVPVGSNKVISVTGGDDVSGKAYVVDAGSGQVFTTPKKVAGGGSGSSAVGTGSQTGEYGCTVSFSKAATQRYGFDQIGDGRTKPDSYFLKSKTGEKIDWKSLESGSTDFVNINVSGTCSADSLRYLRESGLLTPSAPNKKGRQLLLTGLSGGEEDILSVAVAKTKMGSDSSSREILTLAGALGLVSYDRISRNVVLVPVNGAQCPDNIGLLGKELNDIYGPAVVSWNVSVEKNLELDKIKGKVFEHSGTGTLSKYTSDMREVINEFKRQRDTDRHTLYLFFINENTATKTGFMPLASEYGFIFNFRTETHVIAHELGHSKDFNLRHTFSEKAQHFLSERSTQNLMDYAGGSELWKYQWDLIHDPEKIFFAWGQDEEEGAMMKGLYFVNYEEQNIVINYEMVDEYENLTYITPSGKPFVLPQSYQPSFTGTINGNEPRDLLGIPRGVLLGFKDNNGKKWLANFTDPSNGSISFNGYKNNKEIKEIKIVQGNEHNVLAGIENNDCHLEILSGKFNYAIETTENYKGEGVIIKGEEVQFADKEFLVKSIRLYNNCTPDHWLELPSVNYEIFSNNVSARYNAYGKGGVLCKLSTGNYYYSNTDDKGEEFFMMWNEAGERWDFWTPPNPDCLSCELRELLTIRTLVGLFIEDGHMYLDIIGMIPVVGEVADGLNGIWYLIEGENGEATMCMASAVPFIGWVSTGGKWVFKGGKKVSSFVVKNSDNALKIIKKNENLFAEITKRINDNPDFSIESVELLTTDLKSNEKLLNSLIEKPELVDSWKAIKYSGDDDLAKLATNLDELDLVSKNLDDVTKFGGYKEWNRVLRGAVKNGDELLYRLSKIDAPKPEIYKGNFYRTVDNGLDPLHTHPIPRGKSHRYSKPGEDALYFSSSKEGNIQELTHWGKEIEGNTTTYLFKNIDSENLLDLSNSQVRERFGISLNQITGESYEFSHILGSWGQGKYNGIIAPSARGVSDNKYFVNIVIFNSGTANSLIKGKELIKIVN